MRRFTIGLFAAALVAAPLAAQSWRPEIGVQGGFARLKPAGTNARDQLDFFDVPGESFLYGALSYNALFAIVPLHQRIALEPSFAASQLGVGGTEILTSRIGARADYAITSHVYAGLGAELIYVATSGGGTARHIGPLAVQAGVGYRFGLTGRLNGRVEAHWAASKASRKPGIGLPALDIYGLLFGVSAPLDGAAPARGAQRNPSDRAWEPALGLAGGYSSIHFVGGPTVIGMNLPGLSTGSSLGVGTPLPTPASFFAVIPVGGKLAVEPGLNFNRVQQFGFLQTIALVNLSVRADYAVGRAWYAGLGPVAVYTKTTGSAAAAQMGVTAAWGYRFHVAGEVGGRLEANYTMFAHQHVLNMPPVNVLGLGAAVTMGL